MKHPIILFIPVSSTQGVGEYTRSLILAEEIKRQIQDVDIHFVLNKNINYGDACPFTVHYSSHSATKDTPKVKEVLNNIKPDLVIFDCAGRSEQFAYAKSLGAQIIFISQHKKKRARGLKINRIFNTDIHWVVQPNYAIDPLSYFERLKLKLFSIKAPQNIGPILPKIAELDPTKILEQYQLIKNEFILFSAGSGGHYENQELAADIFFEAAKLFYESTKIRCVMVFGSNYPKKLPINSSILCLKYISNKDFVVLVNEAKGRVISAGDTLLQAIELQKPSVASVVSKDQPMRLAASANQSLVVPSLTTAEDLFKNAMFLLNNENYRLIENKIKKLQPIQGLDIAVADVINLLERRSINETVSINSKIETSNKPPTKRYLFFVSQDYSFPVLRPLQKAIESRGDEVRWFLYGDEVHAVHLQKNENSLLSIVEVVAYNPMAVFVPGNVVPSFIPGLKIEVFHGLPSTKAKKGGQLYHYIIRGMFDLYCTQGPSSTKKFNVLKEKYRFFNVEETGWCKLDPLFNNHIDENIERKKTIFLASTFSPRFSKAEIIYPLIFNMMKKYDFEWYITLHPKMNSEIVALYKSINLPNVTFVETTELIQNFKKADIMLCDTSSIIYEFMTQLKPVITFQTEKVEPHLINVEELDKLEGVILDVLNNLDMNRENIEKNVANFHPYTDGKSSDRILNAVEQMLSGKDLPIKNKPMNLLRNYKLRQEFSYWKI